MSIDPQGLADTGCAGQSIPRHDARALLDGAGFDLMDLLGAAGRVRRHFFDNTVSIHVLDNVRSGACPEDCGYCGQSKDSTAPLKPYKLKNVDRIVADARAARDSGAFRFCMAASGRGPSATDLNVICQAVERIKAMGLRTCLSAGLMDEAAAQRLKDAGLDRLNHNLNTSRAHYPAICSTHTYDDRLATLRAARAAGLGICCGLIVGMGETYDDLVDVALELAELKAESIPVNFLLPIEGNPVANPKCDSKPLDPSLVLRVLCMVRLVNPAAEVRIAAGREHHLRSMQPLALWPANSLFMDGYLLSEGDTAEQTIRMILDAGFVPRLDEGTWPDRVRKMIEQGPTPASPQTATLKLGVIR